MKIIDAEPSQNMLVEIPCCPECGSKNIEVSLKPDNRIETFVGCMSCMHGKPSMCKNKDLDKPYKVILWEAHCKSKDGRTIDELLSIDNKKYKHIFVESSYLPSDTEFTEEEMLQFLKDNSDEFKNIISHITEYHVRLTTDVLVYFDRKDLFPPNKKVTISYSEYKAK